MYNGQNYNICLFCRNPTPIQDPLLNVTWYPVTENEMNYLDIDKELTMKKDLAKERIAFWEELQSTLLQSNNLVT